MKYKISFLLILAVSVFAFITINNPSGKKIIEKPSAMKRMRQLGPIIEGIDITEILGNVKIRITADRLSLKKTKILGFDSALKKKPIALNLALSISKDKKLLLQAYKDQEIFSLKSNEITIKHPDITYPHNFGEPEFIRIDKTNKILYIKYSDKVDTWDLNNIK